MSWAKTPYTTTAGEIYRGQNYDQILLDPGEVADLTFPVALAHDSMICDLIFPEDMTAILDGEPLPFIPHGGGFRVATLGRPEITGQATNTSTEQRVLQLSAYSYRPEADDAYRGVAQALAFTSEIEIGQVDSSDAGSITLTGLPHNALTDGYQVSIDAAIYTVVSNAGAVLTLDRAPVAPPVPGAPIYIHIPASVRPRDSDRVHPSFLFAEQDLVLEPGTLAQDSVSSVNGYWRRRNQRGSRRITLEIDCRGDGSINDAVRERLATVGSLGENGPIGTRCPYGGGYFTLDGLRIDERRPEVIFVDIRLENQLLEAGKWQTEIEINFIP